MAIIHRGKNGLQEQIDQYERKRTTEITKHVVITLALIVISLLLSSESLRRGFVEWANAPQNRPESLLIGLFIGIGIMLSVPVQLFLRFVVPIYLIVNLFQDISISSYKNQKQRILEAGLSGENKALSVFSALPGEYHVFTNLNIYYNAEKSETDAIIVGPTGVFIVETKGFTGEIRGDWSDKHLKHLKNNGTTSYEHNPLHQVSTHVYRLSGYLKEHGIKIWIEGLAFFSGTDIILDVTDKCGNKEQAVFTYETRSQLLSRIQNAKQHLSQSEQQRIISLLTSLINS